MIATSAPYSQYFDKNGDPLDSGFVYFGVPDANPETSPIPAYWDEAGTQPVAQPARTLAGYIVRNGTPARVYVEGAYSQTVKNKKGELVYYAANSEDYSNLPVNVATIEATAGQTNVNLPFSYTRGNNSLAVYLNGTLLLKDRDYIETSETAIQMLNPLKIGPGGADEVTAIGGRLINPSSAVGTVSAAALAAGSGAGLVGYDPSLTFPADTVGERLQATTYTVDAITSVDATTLNLQDGDMIVARGRSAASDGGGGLFRYVAASTQTVDDGLVFAPTVGTGRLFRDGWTVLGFNGPVSVRWFGANGTYIAGEDEQILDCVAAVEAFGGGTVFFPQGRYFVLQPIINTLAPIQFEGAGVNTTLITGAHTNGPVFRIAHYFSSVRNLAINSTSTRIAAAAGSGATMNCGILDNSPSGITRRSVNAQYRNLLITDQPSHGIALVNDWKAAEVFDFQIYRCGGHGIFGQIGDAGYGSSPNSQIGGLHIAFGVINDCDGHSICIGTTAGQDYGYRIHINNIDTAHCAISAGVRNTPTNMWIRSENTEVSRCGIGGFSGETPSRVLEIGGIYVNGRNFRAHSNRFIDIKDYAFDLGADADDADIEIGQITGDVIVSLDPAVRVAAGAVGVRARAGFPGNVTTPMTAAPVNSGNESLMYDVKLQGLRSTIGDISLADDIVKVFTFSAAATRGIAVIGGNSSTARPVMVAFRVGDGSAYCRLLSEDNPVQGALGTTGVATLVGGTVVVSTTAVTAGSVVRLFPQNTSGTAGNLTVSARTAGTSFTIQSTSGTDTRNVAWEIIEPSRIAVGVGTLTDGSSDGVDTCLNVYADSASNTLFVKNRRGSTITFAVTFLSLANGELRTIS